MPQYEENPSQAKAVLQGEVADQLRRVFDSLPKRTPVYLFSQKGNNDIFNDAARELVRAFADLSNKLEFNELDLDHELARRWNVQTSPTILFDPERYHVRYMGAPYGEEARTFVGVLVLVGLGRSNLSSQSLKVLEKITSPREVKVFVSPTCPYCPDEALNAVKAAVEKPSLISVEIIDIQSNPEIANQYSAFSVPQVFANEVLIAQGAQPEELFISSLDKMEQQTVFIPDVDAEQIETDVVIVGGGPAGLAAGIYTVRSGLKTVVVERGTLGGQVATTPVVENYPGFARVPGKTLVDILVSHALEYVQILQGEEVVDIQTGNPIQVTTNRRRFTTRAVIMATGANYKRLGAPGESRLSGRGVSYCATCDGSLFRGKRVLVVGGGDSAATEALYLHHIGVSVILVHRRETLRAQDHLIRDLNNNNIPIIWSSEVKEINGKERVSDVSLYNVITKETRTVRVDGVFVAIGYSPTVELARKIGIELTPDGYIKHDSHHRTNISGIYSAGDVEGGFKQIVTAMGQGTEAALSVYEDLVHPYWQAETTLEQESA